MDEAFVYQALSGTPFAMHRMVFTGVAMILPMQMLTESYLRWRKLI